MPVFFVAIFMIYLQKERLILAMTIKIENDNLFYSKVFKNELQNCSHNKTNKNFIFYFTKPKRIKVQ